MQVRTMTYCGPQNLFVDGNVVSWDLASWHITQRLRKKCPAMCPENPTSWSFLPGLGASAANHKEIMASALLWDASKDPLTLRHALATPTGLLQLIHQDLTFWCVVTDMPCSNPSIHYPLSGILPYLESFCLMLVYRQALLSALSL